MSRIQEFYHDQIEKGMRTDSFEGKNRFSIRTLMQKKNEPKREGQCLYLIRVSQLIKDTTGSGQSYSDTYLECTKLKKRITKKHCRNCVMYKRCNNGN